MTAKNHRAIVFQTVAGEPQRAESPGRAPALRIPRWDRHDNDAGDPSCEVGRTDRKTGRRAKLIIIILKILLCSEPLCSFQSGVR